MAAKTPDAIYQDNLGSVNLIRATFGSTNIDDADTWTSGITGIVDYWFQPKNDPATQTHAGINIALSSGVFTFYPGADNCEGTLFILRRG
jgi:hypothetical protein